MNIPEEFDAIRPWEPEDLPDVYDRLLSNEQFQQIVSSVMTKASFLNSNY